MSDYDDYDDDDFDNLDDFEREQRIADAEDECLQQTAFAVYLNFEDMGWL